MHSAPPRPIRDSFADVFKWAEACGAWERDNPAEAAALRARHEADERARNAAEQAERLPGHLAACGVQLEQREAILRGLQPTPAVREVRAWIDSPRTFLVLLGGAGAGKSCAAAEVMLWARAPRKPAGYAWTQPWEYSADRGWRVSAAALLAEPFNRELWNRAARVAWLVMDDLGVSPANDYAHGALDELIDVRWAQRRRCVVTSNLDPQTLAKYVGPRAWDRISGSGAIKSAGAKSLRGGAR